MTTPTRFDIRQCIAHDMLDQIASAAGLSVDAILRALNSETTMPLRLSATSPSANMVLNVGNIAIANPQTARNRTIPHISNLLPAFSGGTITFPAASGSNITFSTGGSTPVLLTCPSGQYVKVLVYLNASGNLGAVVGTNAATADLATVPPGVNGAFNIGYVVVHNTAGTIDTITNSTIYQFISSNSEIVGTANTFLSFDSFGQRVTVKNVPTGEVVGTFDVQVLTNKDIDGGTASNTSRLTVPKNTKANLDGLTRKEATLVYGTDTGKAYVDDGLKLKEIGSGASGINYLSAHFGADALGTVALNLGNVVGTSDRTANKAQWGTSHSAAIISQSTDASLRGTTNYLVQYSADTQFVETPLFALDGEDVGKPLFLSFDVTGVATSDDVQAYACRYDSGNILRELISIAGIASATTPFSARVPTGTTSFKGFFITGATATDQYSIRWRRNAANTSMRLDSFSVGPQIQLSGAPITDWQSYTPTFTGFGTVSTQSFLYKRVGNSLLIAGRFVTGTVTGVEARVSFPTGLTGLASLPTLRNCGAWSTTAAPVRNPPGRFVLCEPNVGYVTFGFEDWDGGAGNASLVKMNGNVIFGNTQTVAFYAEIPVNEWSSNITLADRAVEEFAFNTGNVTAAGGSDTTSFGWGIAGTPILAMDSVTANSNTNFQVRFSTPILPTDRIEIEFSNDRVIWTPSSQLYPKIAAGTSLYGVDWVKVNATDISVRFGNKGALSYAAAGTYGSNGIDWASSSAVYWRVRKTAGGAVVGYPISARNIVGDTSGTAVPAGMIGETRLAEPGGNINYSASATFMNVAIMSNIKAGVYIAFGTLWASPITGTGVADLHIAISANSGTTTTDHAFTLNWVNGIASNSAANDMSMVLPGVPVVSDGSKITVGGVQTTSTTLYLKSKITYAGGQPVCRGYLTLVRIA